LKGYITTFSTRGLSPGSLESTLAALDRPQYPDFERLLDAKCPDA
jgi:hypothetical protein